MSGVRLQRVAFKTSRLAEFCGEKELTAQTGHAPEDWAVVILKELVDNSLDACEEAEIAPEIDIKVSTETGEIVISDNGPGLPADTLIGTLDYTSRVSSREAYVSPSRGQQGNALKTIVAMPFALDGARGVTIVEAHGTGHRVVFEMDPVRREPRILTEISPSLVQKGTRVTVQWPKKACPLLEEAEERFVQIAGDFTTFNPHLALTLEWDGKSRVRMPATDPTRHKWRTCDPTSAHWYDVDSLSRYIAAHIARDEDLKRPGRTVREFVEEFRGLKRPSTQKFVLAELDAARVSLADFFNEGKGDVGRLLAACKANTRPVKPEDLGILGSDHLLANCLAVGAAEASFKYQKRLGTTASGLPYAAEAAFAYCPGKAHARAIAVGINFSVGLSNAFRFGPFDDLSSALTQRYISPSAPAVFILHYTCPRVDYTDRGKSALNLPLAARVEIREIIEAVTKAWEKQRLAELRHASAAAKREERLLKEAQAKPKKEGPPAPTGALAETIHLAAAAGNMSIDDLVVLSANNDPYTAWRQRRAAEWFAQVFNHFVMPDATKHLRGLFYLLVMSSDGITGADGKPFVNDHKHWQALQSASKAARWLGLIEFDRIIDERNAPPEIYVPGVTPIATAIAPGTRCEIPATAECALPAFLLAGFNGRQSHRIIFYGEKSSLAAVLRPIAEQIGAEMILDTGEGSNTHIAGMAKRASQDGRPAIVFYFSDFDPGGHQMPISVARKLQALRDLRYPKLNIKLYQAALTLEQIRKLGLPSKPLKPTEKRASRWREVHSHEQTEIDAMVELHPEELRAATFDAIAPFYDADLDRRVYEVERKWRRKADEALKAHPGYQDASDRITDAWERASDAAEELHDEQQQAAEILKDRVPPAPELPEAEPKGETKPPLFDSEVDFVTATRQLIRHKKLIGMSDRGPP